MTQRRDYSRWRVLAVLFGLLVLILADHINSATFALNSGQGGVETSYSQLDESACAPCGAPCPSRREGDG
ncbi:hypothetical protein KBTX_01591 [wastewater metagenome]|uniref:Uncharacterized protein n=2 Tax=unclassified sequences TaxID=12908 RepID=A0A5B8R9L9_9ZZZZ|nr:MULTISPECIES: hypothetical protein [Arhodomonas]MCS4502632.1 hypothetical protein [Arhodomonas aquaeolei]QEA05271.1 hypothetical protein KBTEX_01591 [uncultured organism]